MIYPLLQDQSHSLKTKPVIPGIHTAREYPFHPCRLTFRIFITQRKAERIAHSIPLIPAWSEMMRSYGRPASFPYNLMNAGRRKTMKQTARKSMPVNEAEKKAGGSGTERYCPFCGKKHPVHVLDNELTAVYYTDPAGNPGAGLFHTAVCPVRERPFYLAHGQNGIAAHEKQIYVDGKTRQFLEGRWNGTWVKKN